MRDIDIKVIKFLLSGKAYSDTAVIKNLGIGMDELQKSYKILEKEGYLESYKEYASRTKNSFNTKETECSSTCGGSCSQCSTTVLEEDYKNIKVITEKAVKEFD